jgi:hypothetical protein
VVGSDRGRQFEFCREGEESQVGFKAADREVIEGAGHMPSGASEAYEPQFTRKNEARSSENSRFGTKISNDTDLAWSDPTKIVLISDTPHQVASCCSAA